MRRIGNFAYNAEKTVRHVLSRIPAALDRHDTEILVIDDASTDRTFDEAVDHRKEGACRFKLTVLVNPVKLGYGGNQKMGFQYAIRHGFDLVALIHGDGQYAPEILPEMIAPIIEGRADAVFGSRMLAPKSALKGGMPLYKFVGNRILSRFQNIMLKSSLSEFHSGYRVYSTLALKRIPFELNVPDFHFDTEIIIQLMRANQRIVEIAIPTYYGDEIRHVKGLRYAFNVFKTTLVARFQDYGLFYQQKFDIAPDGKYAGTYQSKLHFESSHTYAVDSIPPFSRVLEFGCAEGYVTEALVKKGCQVTGIDRNPPHDQTRFETFFQADLDHNPLPVALKDFQIVLLLDVIEHLANPEAFTRHLLHAAGENPDTEIIITTANVGFLLVRGMLSLGSFNYGKRGILDLTHTRLFTFGSLRELLKQSGARILEERGIPAPFPLALGKTALALFLLRVNRWLIGLSRGLFAYQIFMRVKPLPNLDWLLDSAHRESESRQNHG